MHVFLTFFKTGKLQTWSLWIFMHHMANPLPCNWHTLAFFSSLERVPGSYDWEGHLWPSGPRVHGALAEKCIALCLSRLDRILRLHPCLSNSCFAVTHIGTFDIDFSFSLLVNAVFVLQRVNVFPHTNHVLLVSQERHSKTRCSENEWFWYHRLGDERCWKAAADHREIARETAGNEDKREQEKSSCQAKCYNHPPFLAGKCSACSWTRSLGAERRIMSFRQKSVQHRCLASI